MLDIALMVLLLVFVLRGLFRGLVREVMGLAGVLAAVLASAAYFHPLANFLRRVMDDASAWWDAVAFAAILALVFVLFVYLGAALARLIHRGPFSGLDRLLGAATGLVKGVLICYLLLNVLLMALPVGMLVNPGPESANLVSRSWLAPHVVRAGRYLVDLVPSDLTREMQERAGLIKRQLDPRRPDQPSPR